MAVSIYSGSRMLESLETMSHFTISVLTDKQRPVAEWLGAPGQPLYGQLNTIATESTPRFGQPVISDALVWFELELVDSLTVATHDLVVGQVVDLAYGSGQAKPLVRWGRSYGTFSRADRSQ